MILTATVLLYLFPALWMLFRRGWPIRAGLSMIGACMLPFYPLALTDEPIGPGTGLLILLTLPLIGIALLIMLGGIIRAIFRRTHASRGMSEGFSNT